MTDKQIRLVSGSHDVGFCRPPNATRFKKGTSGNPAGRPKGAKNKVKTMQTRLNKLIQQEAYREIEINDRGVPVQLPMIGAVVKALGIKAAKGHIGAQRLFLEIANTAETMELHEKQDAFRTAVHYKQRAYAQIVQAKAAGEPVPVILPDPDDVVVDERTLSIFIHGPKDDGEKREWDQLWGELARCYETVELNRERLSSATDPAERGKIEFEVEVGLYIFKMRALGIMHRWRLPGARLVDDRALQAQLDVFVMEGTQPVSPFP